MCHPATAALVKQVVTNRVDADEMFTAFDISLAVKEIAKKTGQQAERHRDMKGAIHAEMQNYLASGVYRRELVNVGAPTKAFLYFPDGADPSDYVPVGHQKSVSTVQPAALPSPPPVATDDSDDDDEGDGRRVDARGSLSVPSHLVLSRGLNSGDRIFVRPDNGNLVVSQVDNGNATTSYVVDKNHNIRITQSQLAGSGFTPQDTFDFSDNGDDIVISKHLG
jgi:hypothetical protein